MSNNQDVGNVAAMREALVEARKVIKSMGGYWARETLPIIDAALTAPPRNCDVGTVKEQAERFEAFCQSNMQFYRDMFGRDDEGRLDGWDCREDCPIGKMIDSGTAVSDHCQLAWAQMPYEERGDR